MIGAYLYILRCTLKNAILAKLRRLREPKYAIALIVGLGYFVFIVGFNFLSVRMARQHQQSVPPDFSGEWFEWGAIVMGLLYLSYIWVFKGAEAGLFFRPAEMHYLFTAPMTRRQIIHYYILRTQPAMLFSTLIIALFMFVKMPGGTPIYAMLGWYLISNILFLHSTAASLVRVSLFRHGKAGLRHSFRPLVVFVLIGAIIFFQSSKFSLTQVMKSGAVEDSLRQVFDSPLGFIAFYPLRVLGRLMVSRDLGAFLRALLPTLGLVALHYVWVIRSDVAFEEASEERSRQIAERIERWKKGKLFRPPRRGRNLRQPFRLGPSGPAATAIFWKNLISATRLPAVLTMVGFVLSEIGVSYALDLAGVDRQVRAVFALPILIVALIVSLAGPLLLRNDLRQDLPCLDILKTLPVTGVEVVVGQVLAPLAILCAIQLLLCPLGILFLVQGGGLSVGAGLSLLATVALIYPMYAALWLLVENSMVLYFPDWMAGWGSQKQGIEGVGTRIVYMVMVVAALAVLLLPAILVAAVGMIVGLVFSGGADWPALVVLMAGVAASILAGECFLIVKFLGRKYESFDFATECTAREGL